MQQRPAGVVLSALALGLAALVLLLLGLLSFFAVIAGRHPPAGAMAPAASAAVLTAASLLMTLLYLGLAAWAFTTLRGLLRMRSWARISAMVIAACMVGFGLLFAVGLAGAQSLLAAGSVPIPPNVDPALLRKALLILAVLSFFVAALGVAWLLYFASRSTQDAFLRAQARQPGHAPPAPSAGYASPPPSRRMATPPAFDPLTDFTIARPIERKLDVAASDGLHAEPFPSPPPDDDPHAS